MIIGRIEHGQIQLASALPEAWEGQTVKIEPCTPDEPLIDLKQRLSALHALGPMEYEPGEQKAIEQELAALNASSLTQMQNLAGRLP